MVYWVLLFLQGIKSVAVFMHVSQQYY